jgi:hypothetical protein
VVDELVVPSSRASLPASSFECDVVVSLVGIATACRDHPSSIAINGKTFGDQRRILPDARDAEHPEVGRIRDDGAFLHPFRHLTLVCGGTRIPRSCKYILSLPERCRRSRPRDGVRAGMVFELWLYVGSTFTLSTYLLITNDIV